MPWRYMRTFARNGAGNGPGLARREARRGLGLPGSERAVEQCKRLHPSIWIVEISSAQRVLRCSGEIHLRLQARATVDALANEVADFPPGEIDQEGAASAKQRAILRVEGLGNFDYKVR